LRQAIPCGLILNELVTNALKYAFAKNGAGEILVTLACDQNDLVKLTVSDDGAGLPPGFDWRKSPSLGLRIVDILSRQIDGLVEQVTGNGTTFSLTFRRDSAFQSRRQPPAMEAANRGRTLVSSAS